MSTTLHSSRYLFALALLMAWLASLPARAIDARYDAGDLILGVQSSVNTLNVLEVNLGPPSLIKKAAGTRVNLFLGNIGSELAATFGPTWYDDKNLFFGIVSANNSGASPLATPDANKDYQSTVYASRRRKGNATIGAADSPQWVVVPASVSGAAAIMVKQAAGFNNFQSGGIAVVPKSSSNDWSDTNPLDGITQGTAYGIFAGGIQHRFNGGTFDNGNFGGLSQVEGAVDLYRIARFDIDGSTPGEGSFLGTVIITQSGDLFFMLTNARATVSTSAASEIGPAAATLRGTVRANGLNAIVSFQYGPTTSYGSTVAGVPSLVTGGETTAVSAAISGLTRGTTYHYRALVQAGNITTFGSDATFTTLADPPTAATGGAGAITQNSAQLTGAVNPRGAPTQYYFEYGFTAGYGSRTPDRDAGLGNASVDVQEALTGLGAGLPYHFRIVAFNAGGMVVGNDATFTTSGSGGGTPTAPPTVVTSGAASVGPAGATLQGTANPNGGVTLAFFEYGLDTNYGSTTPAQSLGNGATTVSVSMPVAGLQPGTLYHFRLVGANQLGNSFGSDATFTTTFPSPGVTTGLADAVGSTFATLKGTVNPNGAAASVFFEFGTTASYGTTVAAAGAFTGTAALPASVVLAPTALLPGTTYHFRIFATNSGGSTLGEDGTFTTLTPQAPLAGGDVIFTTRFRAGNGSIDVLANDIDQDTGTRDGLLLDDVSGQQFPSRGTVVPNSNGTVTYKPLDGFDPDGDSFTYTVKKANAPELTAQATVRVLSFVPFAGSYTDVFKAAPDSETPEGGALTCALNRFGAGTLTLNFLARNYNDKISFDSAGRAVADFPKIDFPRGTVLHLELQLDESGAIHAILADHQTPTDDGQPYYATLLSAGAGGTDVISGVHNGFFEIEPGSEAGLASVRGSAASGFGFNIAAISKKKRGRFIGRVPDFTGFSKGSVAPVRNGYIVNPAFYGYRGAKRGGLLGRIDLGGASSSAAFVSDFQWRRDSVENVFVGFNRRLLLGGELYRASGEAPADAALRVFGGDGRAQVRFEGGGFSSPKVAQIKVTLASVLRGDGFIEATGGMPKLKFRFQAGTGRYSGSFDHPDTGSKTKFQGVMRRRSDSIDTRKGAGAFKSADGSVGMVTVLPLGT